MTDAPLVVRIDLAITLLSALSVGAAGSNGAIVDKALMRDGWGRPMIPGSQVKGLIRHACERIARALDCAVCHAPVPDAMCPADPAITRHATEEPHLYRAAQAAMKPRQCIVCAAFGSPLYPSPLRFDDAIDLGSGQILPEASGRASANDSRIRTGVGLDRRRGTALEEVLFTVETTQAGRILSGTIGGSWHDTPPDVARGLVGLLVAGLQQTTRWGGASSRGLGWASCDLEVLLNGQREDPETLVKEMATLCRIVS